MSAARITNQSHRSAEHFRVHEPPATLGIGKPPRRGFSSGPAVSRSGSPQPHSPGGDRAGARRRARLAAGGERVLVQVESTHGTAAHSNQLCTQVENHRQASCWPARDHARLRHVRVTHSILPRDRSRCASSRGNRLQQSSRRCVLGDAGGRFVVDELLVHLKEEGLVDRLTSAERHTLATCTTPSDSSSGSAGSRPGGMTELWGKGTPGR
jgi:hypothetical protein